MLTLRRFTLRLRTLTNAQAGSLFASIHQNCTSRQRVVRPYNGFDVIRVPIHKLQIPKLNTSQGGIIMRYLVTFLMLVCISTLSSAQLLVDNFQYPAGALIDTLGWSPHSGTGNQPDTVSNGGLTYTGYAGSGIGNAVNVFGTGEDVNKGFAQQSSDGSTIYLSALISVVDTGSNISGGYFLHMGDRASPTSFFSFCARVFAKVDASGNVVFGLSNTSTATYGSTNFAKNTTYLLIVKYTINTAGNDTTKLWVVSSGVPVDEATAGTPEVTVDSQTGTSSDVVNAVGIRQTSGIPDVVLDGLRIATTWQNSVGGVDVPSALIAPSSIDFGTMKPGMSANDTLTVTNTGYATLNISAVSSSNTLFVVSPSTGTVGSMDSMKFAVTYSPTTTGQDTSAIVFTSDAASSPDTVWATGAAEVGFEASPTLLDFGNVWKDSTMVDSLTVSNSSTTARLVIDSVTSSNSLFTVTPGTDTVEVSSSLKFAVSFMPTAKGAQTGYLVFYHNGPSHQDTVMVKGTGIVMQPEFSSSPASLNFSAIMPGQSVKDSITVTNTGYASLSITNATISDASFSISTTTASIDSQASKKFGITFAPTSAGNKYGLLVFTDNTTGTKDTVWLQGLAVTPVSIAEARKNVDTAFIASHSITKDTLAIFGVVTTPNLQSVGSQTAIFIQDTSAGIEVFNYILPPMTLAIGDSVFVTGTVLQYHGLVEFRPLNISDVVDTVHFNIVKHNAAVPAAKHLTLHQLVMNAEMYEGSLVEVDTLYHASGTWPGPLSNGYVYLTNASKQDTIQMFTSSSTNIAGSTEPLYPINVTGVIAQYSSSSTVYNNGYEIQPFDTLNIVHTPGTAGVDQTDVAVLPKIYELYNNYPNPFNPSTTIMYGLPQQSRVSVKIYSVLGQEVRTLVDKTQGAAYYHVTWDGKSNSGLQVSSGVYFFRIIAQPIAGSGQPFTQVRKMLLMK